MWFLSLRVRNEAIRWYATPGTVIVDPENWTAC
jgi:hypothetical protein